MDLLEKLSFIKDKERHEFDRHLVNIVTSVSMLYLLILVFELYMLPSTFAHLFFIVFDTFISALFFFEYSYFFYKAKERKEYMKYHIIDLFACIPVLFLLSLSPLFSFFNLFKLLRGLLNCVRVYEVVIRRRLPLLVKILTLFILIIVYFSVSIVNFEKGVNKNLSTFHDGVWFAVTTITSVGYGDTVPQTALGKGVAIILMMFGIGLSSAMGGLVVAWLLRPTQERIYGREARIQQHEKEIMEREGQIERLEKIIEHRLDRLEEEIEELHHDTPKKKK